MDVLPRELIEIIISMVPSDDVVTKLRSVNKQYFSLTQRLLSEIVPSFKRQHTSNDHQLMVIARDYPSITSLNVSKWDISVSALGAVLTKFPRLKELHLPALRLSKGNDLPKHEIASLTSLSLDIPTEMHTRFTHGSDGILSVKTLFPNLEHLELTNVPSQSEIDNILKGLTGLKSLMVHGPNTCSISNLPLLKQLTICLSSKTLINILNCPMLETLNIKFCDLRRFDFLHGLPNLQNLTLEQGFHDPWGSEQPSRNDVELVENIIKGCPKLKTLRLYKFHVTSKDLERLIYGLPQLKRISVYNSKYDEALYEAALILQAKKEQIEITVAKRKLTEGLDIEIYNSLRIAPSGEEVEEKPLNSYVYVEKTREPSVECQYCHMKFQCAPEIHEDVCLRWPGWSCLFQESGCTKSGMTKEELRVHIAKCDFNFIKCMMHNCGETIRRHERQAHDEKHLKTFEYRLKETYMICPNLQRGCMETFATKSDILRHVSKCQHAHCLCMSCKDSFASVEQCLKHMSECRVTAKKIVMPEECQALILEKATKFGKTNSSRNMYRM